MENASPKAMLERLEEEWVAHIAGAEGDGELYRDLEVERRFWMLSALRSFSRKKGRGLGCSAETGRGKRRVLSLYESQG